MIGGQIFGEHLEDDIVNATGTQPQRSRGDTLETNANRADRDGSTLRLRGGRRSFRLVRPTRMVLKALREVVNRRHGLIDAGVDGDPPRTRRLDHSEMRHPRPEHGRKPAKHAIRHPTSATLRTHPLRSLGVSGQPVHREVDLTPRSGVLGLVAPRLQHVPTPANAINWPHHSSMHDAVGSAESGNRDAAHSRAHHRAHRCRYRTVRRWRVPMF